MNTDSTLFQKFQTIAESTDQIVRALNAINGNLKQIYARLDSIENQISDLKIVKLDPRRGNK